MSFLRRARYGTDLIGMERPVIEVQPAWPHEDELVDPRILAEVDDASGDRLIAQRRALLALSYRVRVGSEVPGPRYPYPPPSS